MWRRNAMPKPTPSCAPSNNPGISANTKDDPSFEPSMFKSTSQTPKLGTTVVKG